MNKIQSENPLQKGAVPGGWESEEAEEKRNRGPRGKTSEETKGKRSEELRERGPVKILLDTNFFLVPFQLGVNILSEFERLMGEPFRMMTISPVMDELEAILRSGKGADRISARLGMELLRGISVIDFQGNGDDAIVDFASHTKGIIVATNDSKLRKRLKSAGVRTIFVRNRSKLQID